MKYENTAQVDSYWECKIEVLRDQTVTLSILNPTWTGLGSNSGLLDETPVTIQNNHGTRRIIKVWNNQGAVRGRKM
jgi:hypothetical protein